MARITGERIGKIVRRLSEHVEKAVKDSRAKEELKAIHTELSMQYDTLGKKIDALIRQKDRQMDKIAKLRIEVCRFLVRCRLKDWRESAKD
jgi:chaperonin cofactor prefoldin